MSLWGRSMKIGKKIANKKIRRLLKNPNLNISNGHYYKYLGLDSWELWEFKFLETKKDTVNRWKKDQVELAYGIRRLEDST